MVAHRLLSLRILRTCVELFRRLRLGLMPGVGGHAMVLLLEDPHGAPYSNQRQPSAQRLRRPVKTAAIRHPEQVPGRDLQTLPLRHQGR